MSSPSIDIEDFLAQQGIPAFCFPLADADVLPGEDSTSDSRVFFAEIVVPIAKEKETYSMIDHGANEIRMLCRQDDYLLLPRTVHYHFAMRRFRRVGELFGFHTSTTIPNLASPDVRKTDTGEVLTYNVDVVVIQSQIDSNEHLQTIAAQELRNSVQSFNRASRYLKIGTTRLAYATTRVVLTGWESQFKRI